MVLSINKVTGQISSTGNEGGIGGVGRLPPGLSVRLSAIDGEVNVRKSKSLNE